MATGVQGALFPSSVTSAPHSTAGCMHSSLFPAHLSAPTSFFVFGFPNRAANATKRYCYHSCNGSRRLPVTCAIELFSPDNFEIGNMLGTFGYMNISRLLHLTYSPSLAFCFSFLQCHLRSPCLVQLRPRDELWKRSGGECSGGIRRKRCWTFVWPRSW